MVDLKSTLDMIQELDIDLTKMVDSFGKLVRASKLETESAAARSNHVPGDLFAVLVEKVVHRSELALHKVRDLKKMMSLYNVSDVLVKAKRSTAKLQHFKDTSDTTVFQGKGSTSLRLKQLLTQLEEHYYSCGPHEVETSGKCSDSELEELCMQALNAPFEIE